MIKNKLYQLPKEFGEKFVQALRSGEYKQTKGTLFEVYKKKFLWFVLGEESRYCSLGIACKVQGVPDETIKYSLGITSDMRHIYDIPTELGLNSRLSKALVALNDMNKKTFNQIADWIEENVEFY